MSKSKDEEPETRLDPFMLLLLSEGLLMSSGTQRREERKHQGPLQSGSVFTRPPGEMPGAAKMSSPPLLALPGCCLTSFPSAHFTGLFSEAQTLLGSPFSLRCHNAMLYFRRDITQEASQGLHPGSCPLRLTGRTRLLNA